METWIDKVIVYGTLTIIMLFVGYVLLQVLNA